MAILHEVFTAIERKGVPLRLHHSQVTEQANEAIRLHLLRLEKVVTAGKKYANIWYMTDIVYVGFYRYVPAHQRPRPRATLARYDCGCSTRFLGVLRRSRCGCGAHLPLYRRLRWLLLVDTHNTRLPACLLKMSILSLNSRMALPATLGASSSTTTHLFRAGL